MVRISPAQRLRMESFRDRPVVYADSITLRALEKKGFLKRVVYYGYKGHYRTSYHLTDEGSLMLVRSVPRT